MADRGYQLEESEMNRSDWEFDYTASALAKAAEGQRDYRVTREKEWLKKKDEVMAKIKESGLTVHESVASQFANYTKSANDGAQVMVDATLQKDLTECVQKIRTHHDSATEYDGWVQVLNANPEARLKLKHNDWMYFFGK